MAVVLNGLKGHSLSESTSILAIEYNWDRLIGEIGNVLSQVGFDYFSYSVATCRHLKTDIDFERLIQNTQSDLVAGSLPEGILREFMESVAYQDPALENVTTRKGPLVVNSSTVSSCSVADSFWEKKGIHSRVYIPMSGRSSDYWFHYFALYHREADDAFRDIFEQLEPWLLPALKLYHRMLQSVCEQEQNPFLRNEILSLTCLQILKMTSEGMQVKSIADQLKLTEEGITYHITRAKRIFGARNKTHLIAILYDIGLM
ncbi:MAG: helix-turn-helix transcriptional regulator [Neptuniibacter sp.]